ncbi:MAG TPA: LamG-like jellyroll fold domain-containing protein, partial [Dongiaceae bacterium]|nr:LamG-like jellyroll fold domain-containing protein [Dongiaceae bacterium]
VRIYDPTDDAGEPRGKQTLHPGGIMYTACSGIWQPVWLEPVPATHVESLHLVPNIDAGSLGVTVQLSGPTNGMTVSAVAYAGSNEVGRVTGAPGASLQLSVPGAHLWSPADPYLYDLRITVSNSVSPLDVVGSYFGMRKISVGPVDGYQKLLLNNQFVFQFGPLDQGFWPDGIYTAPTDAALKSDIEQEKILGYNMVRKHIKVERARWYYWADRLGLLVWQDMPSVNSYTGNPQPIDTNQFAVELQRLVTGHWNHPAIIMWVIFNESQGQHDTGSLVAMVQGLDPSRLVNEASGDTHYGTGDILDIHSYPNPGCPVSATQAVACGEFGGVGLGITNHTWAPGWGYVGATDGDDLAAKFEGFCYQLSDFVANHGMSAAVYTELTDVETELNGFLTYDRKVRKVDADRIRLAIASVSTPVTVIPVLPTSQAAARTWKYTTNAPAGNWNATNFNDTAWSSGPAGFGAGNPPNTTGLVRTPWNTSDIWLRGTFNPGVLTADQISKLFFMVYHDEDVELYLNGVLAGSASGYVTDYTPLTLTAAGRAALISNGVNTLAVHCKQTGGGQYIDVGLVIRDSSAVVSPRPVPATPTGLTARAGTAGIFLGWDGATEATSYQVKRSSALTGPFTNVVLTPPLNGVTDTNVSYSTTYYYVVAAVNASGVSTDSAPVSATMPAPPKPPTPVLTAWFKADALSGLNNGGAVALWPDSSGRGNDAVQASGAAQPKWITNVIHGLPVIRFNATAGTFLSLPRPVSDDFTIVCVFASSQGVGTGQNFWDGAGLVSGEVPFTVNDFALSLNAQGKVLAGTGNPDVTIASADSSFNDGQPHIATFERTRSTGALQLFVDGAAQGTASAGLQKLTAPDVLVLGAQQTLNNFLNGDIAEVQIYDAALSDADRGAVEGGLRCKYGLGSGVLPAAPTELSASFTGGQVTLDWQPVVGAASYQVFRSTNSAAGFSLVGDQVTATNYLVAGSLLGRTNYYEVRAVSSCGSGMAGNVAAVFLPPPQMSATSGPDTLTLNWPEPANGWELYATSNLVPPVIWARVTNSISSNSGMAMLTLPLAARQQFFRLVGP